MIKKVFVMRPRSALLIALAALVAASLACGPVDGEEPTEEPTEEAIVEEPTETPVEPTPEPPKKSSPTPVPQPKTAAITVDNAGDIEILLSGDISSTVLLATAASPTAHEFATFGFDKVVRIWDADNGDLLHEMIGSAEYGFGLAYSHDGSVLASTGGYHVYFWDTATGELLLDVVINSFAFRAVWAPDSSTLAVVGDQSSKIDIIDPVQGRIVDSLKNPTGYVLWAVAYSPDGKLLATADAEGRVDVIEADTGKIVFQDKTAGRGATWDLEFSPDGSLLASCNAGGGAYIWETDNWEVVLSGDELFVGGCTDGVFSIGSDVYFGVGHDGMLLGWDTDGGDLVARVDFVKVVWAVSMSGDGEFMTIALDDGSAFVLGLP